MKKSVKLPPGSLTLLFFGLGLAVNAHERIRQRFEAAFGNRLSARKAQPVLALLNPRERVVDELQAVRVLHAEGINHIAVDGIARHIDFVAGFNLGNQFLEFHVARSQGLENLVALFNQAFFHFIDKGLFHFFSPNLDKSRFI